MHNNKFVLAIKSGDKVLREADQSVRLPFGTEYSVHLMNLNSVRALVKVSIDGKDVFDGRELIVLPNDSINLEREIRNGNLAMGNRFKFIERTGEIENHRGIKAEDGIVRVEFKYEDPLYTFIKDQQYIRHPSSVFGPSSFDPSYRQYSISPDATKGVMRGIVQSGGPNVTNLNSIGSSVNASAQNISAGVPGITVPGSISNQNFYESSGFKTEPTVHVITLKLCGITNNKPIEKPVTVKTVPICSSCGRKGKSTAKFCSNCGTSLILV